MIEIRTIKPDESERFLRLLCHAFKIDFDRVRSVFFNEPFFDLDRKWALFEDGEMVSILTATPLEFGWGNAIGIAGVATLDEARGQGFAAQLLTKALKVHADRGEPAALLFAEDTRVYESVGFSTIDDVVKAPLRCEINAGDEVYSASEVQSRYDRWAADSPNRLRRDERRWRYWKWSFRLTLSAGAGYLCQEGSLVREAVDIGALGAWPTTESCTWSGLNSMIEKVNAPVESREKFTHLMGIGLVECPEFFLTDQW